LDSLRAALVRAAKSDIVILTGGVSAGKYDLVPQAVQDAGATAIFHKVTQRPGKPFFFASLGARLFFGLPGNPLSCHLCFHRYIAPAIRKMSGFAPDAIALRGRLATPLTVHGPRVVFQLVRIERAPSAETEEYEVFPLIGSSSADLFAAAGTNALLRIDPNRQHLLERETVTVELL